VILKSVSISSYFFITPPKVERSGFRLQFRLFESQSGDQIQSAAHI